MFRFRPYYLETIHCDYKEQKNIDLPVDFDFFLMHEIGTDQKTGSVKSIRFRWTARAANKEQQLLSYIGEQVFDFVDDISKIDLQNIIDIIEVSRKDVIKEFEVQAILRDMPGDMKIKPIQASKAKIILYDLQSRFQ
jgi:hypothetical protein